MNKIIYSIPEELRINSILNFNFDELEEVEKREKTKIFDLFDGLKNRTVKLAYYDTTPVIHPDGEIRYLRYALHRSTRYANKLQLSVMLFINDTLIPLSHKDLDINDKGVSDFCCGLPENCMINLLD